jgi:clan AA aspartic protease (TIGR02281 family)
MKQKNKTAKTLNLIILLLLTLGIIRISQADNVYLKNGAVMEGVIEQETDKYIKINLGFGTTKVYKTKIEKIEKTAERKNKTMKNRWSIEQSIREQKSLKQQEEYDQRVQKRLERIKQFQQEKEVVKKTTEKDDVTYISKRGSVGVTAVVNGRYTMKLLVDTGATSVMINARSAQGTGLDLKPGYKTVVTLADGSQILARQITLDSLKVGEMEAEDVRAIVLKGNKGVRGWDGLLGMSYLNRFVFKIDADNNKLILERPRD